MIGIYKAALILFFYIPGEISPVESICYIDIELADFSFVSNTLVALLTDSSVIFAIGAVFIFVKVVFSPLAKFLVYPAFSDSLSISSGSNARFILPDIGISSVEVCSRTQEFLSLAV